MLRINFNILPIIVSFLVLLLTGCEENSNTPSSVNKLTFHQNMQRTGWNDKETILTPTTVSSDDFGLIWESPKFDDFNGKDPRLFASPLYVNDVVISTDEQNRKKLPVVFAATSAGYVYAVSSRNDKGVAPGTILWSRQLTNKPCLEGDMGILSTPVIDLEKQRIYVVSCDADQHFVAHSMDIGNGKTSDGWPISIGPETVNKPGINKNGTTKFPTELLTWQRGALNLTADGSRLYIPFGKDMASGWIVAIDVNTTKVDTAFSTTAVTEEVQGGMWASGGPSIDNEGRIHIATGANVDVTSLQIGIPGIYPDSEHNWGQSIIQLSDDPEEGFQLTGTYTPFNYCQSQAADIDLGSSGTVVIDLDPATTGTPHLLALVGGKQGNAYLLDRNSLPGSLVKRQECSFDSTTDKSLLSPHDQPHLGQPGPINIFGPYSDDIGWMDIAKSRTTLAYFKSETGENFLYGTGGTKQEVDSPVNVPPGLVKLKIVTEPDKPAYLEISLQEETVAFKNPGSAVISSNGSKDAILWVLDMNAVRSVSLWDDNNLPEPILYAFDPLTLDVIWQSTPGELYTSGKYNEPTIIMGTALVGTDRIQAFGLP